MSDIFLQDDGDIKIDQSGDISIVTDDDEILQFATNTIYTVYGEMIFHPTVGNMVYKRRLKTLESYGDLIIKDCINAIKADDRVKDVPFMEVYYEEEDKTKAFVKFNILTTDEHLISSMATISL